MTGNLFEASAGAEFSADERFRYRLWRRWAAAGPVHCWIMLNPSTADAERNDPTIRRCIGFSQAAGAAAIEVVNLFALRATQPSELVRAAAEGAEVVGLANDQALELAASADLVIAAWGIVPTGLRKIGMPDRVRFRHRDVEERLARRPWPAGGSRERLRCLGHTTGGWPRHPLYVAATQALVLF